MNRISLNKLIKLMNKSQVDNKTQFFASNSGNVQCSQQNCSLKFQIEEDEEFRVQRLLEESVDEEVVL